MNTKSLTRHYDKLTAEERLPLIMAANARGDEQEWKRLINTAPRLEYQVPHTFGLAESLKEIAMFHHMELMDLAALCMEFLALADGQTQDDESNRYLNIVKIAGYIFQAKLAGWRQFCTAHHFDAEFVFSLLPGADLVRRAEQATHSIAFNQPELIEYFQDRGMGISASIDARTVTDGLEEIFRERCRVWD